MPATTWIHLHKKPWANPIITLIIFDYDIQWTERNTEFNYIAKRSSLQALKTSDDKPNIAAEITCKLRAEAKNGIQ